MRTATLFTVVIKRNYSGAPDLTINRGKREAFAIHV